MISRESARPTVRFVRATSFSAAHRYFDPKLSEAENRKLYGSLYRKDGFGHNFLVEAHFEGEIHPLTGMIVNLRDVDEWLKGSVGLLDHKDLNQLPMFKDVSPTPAKIAAFIAEKLTGFVAKHISELRSNGDKREISLKKIRLFEGDEVWVDYFTEA